MADHRRESGSLEQEPPPPAAGSGAGGASEPAEDVLAFAAELAEQLLDVALNVPRRQPVIRKWLVGGRDACAEVQHLRVMRQKWGGRCGYHALLNAATLHDAATHRHTSVLASGPGLIDEGVQRDLNDPMSAYSFITFVERTLGRECCAKEPGDFFWSFGMLRGGVIERFHMKYFMQLSCLPPTLLEQAQGVATTSPPFATPLSAADRRHWEHWGGLGDHTTILMEFGPSSCCMNYNPVKQVAPLQAAVDKLAAAGAACAASANAWAAAGQEGEPPTRPSGSHHAFIVGSGVHWFTIFVEAVAMPTADVRQVPGVQDQRRPLAESHEEPVVVTYSRIGDAGGGVGLQLAEPEQLASGRICGLPQAGHAAAAAAAPLYIPGYKVYIADSLNADHYFTPPSIKHAVVDNFSFEVDRALPPKFVRAGCIEYMTSGEMLVGALAAALTHNIDLQWYLFHAHLKGGVGHMPRAMLAPAYPHCAPDVVAALSRWVARGLVFAAPFLHEQRWRTRPRGETFKDWERAQTEQDQSSSSATPGSGIERRDSPQHLAVEGLLRYFEHEAPPALFRRGFTRVMATMALHLHPEAVPPGTTVQALLDAAARGGLAARSEPPQVHGVPFRGHYSALDPLPQPAMRRCMPFLDGVFVRDTVSAVTGSLALTDPLQPAWQTGSQPALEFAWVSVGPDQRALGLKAREALLQLKNLLGFFGYWADLNAGK